MRTVHFAAAAGRLVEDRIKLIVVEPWFTLPGHPAQSLLNTARVLDRPQDTLYLFSREPNRQELNPIRSELARYGAVHEFWVPHAAPRNSTALAVWSVARIVKRQRLAADVLFLDAHLLTLAMVARMASLLAPRIRSISTLQLFGPEAVVERAGRRALVQAWLLSPRTRLFLRTEELAEAWRQAFPGVAAERIDTLPSLEIPSDAEPVAVVRHGLTGFGVLGQVRTGKGLDWLVPMFRSNSGLGRLRVVGAFFSADQQAKLQPLLQGFDGFEEGFIAEEKLVTQAADLDYLLTLYDAWDCRLEAATFYLAARAGRPVICYDHGWCGRMIKQFGCGVSFPPGQTPSVRQLEGLPRRDSDAYGNLVDGMNRFRIAHSGSARRNEFLRKVTGQLPHRITAGKLS